MNYRYLSTLLATSLLLIILCNKSIANNDSYVKSTSFSWIQNGDFLIDHKTGSKIYMSPSKERFKIDGSLGVCSLIISTEIDSVADREKFINAGANGAIGFFYSIFALEQSQVLSLDYIRLRNEFKELLPESDQKIIDEENEILKRYCKNLSTMTKDDHWSVQFSLLMRDGYIETWQFSGTLKHFKIESLNRRVEAKVNVKNL